MAKLDILTLRNRFIDHAPEGVSILYPNAPAVDPSPEHPFIRWSLGPMTTDRFAMGPNPAERTIGRVYIAVFAPRQQGDAIALDLADECAAIYRNWTWQEGGDFLRCDTPDVQPIDNEPDWYQVRLSIPWQSVRHPQG